jgi:D-alanine-D-alanine ligase-like ATP-grasp enzyme
MTIRDIELTMINKVIDKCTCMGELGNQSLYVDGKKLCAKDYFSKLGIDHTSFDINGQDGAEEIDLSQPIDSIWHNKFDVVTNAGTTEHITDGQIQSFTNIHNICKIGGYMIHSIPFIGCWKGHCPHRYSKNFIKMLAISNGYGIVYDEVIHRKRNDYLVCGILVKTKDEFIVSDKWLNEIERSKDYKLNSDNKK